MSKGTTPAKPKYVTPKYHRVLVSPARHQKLAAEAAKLGISIESLAERKFKAAK